MWACDPALTSEVLSSYNAMGPLFVQTLQSFLAAQCALAGDHLWPPDATESVIEDPHYDFIIVGAGSAGSVVANRLSEVPHWRVLLVEAGGNPSMATEIPQIFYSNMGTHQDWGYKSEPQESACRGYKQNGCAWPRGKTLGGSGSINGMFYVRGNKLDYDEWAANGNIGWNYEDVLKYFKKSENFIGPLSDDNKKFHGINGYLTVQRNGTKHWFEELILKAVAEVGIKELDDINGPSQMGAVVTHSNIKDGKRHSTAKAFLSVFKDRPNLHVLKNAYVTKILFHPKSTTVSGILIQKKGREIEVHARKEVILSAGTVNTPHLLLLSGIGPKEHLESLDIEVKADLAVGENLQDHVFFPVLFTMPSKENLNTLSSITTEFMEYISSNKGILSDLSPHRIIAFVNQSDPLSVSPEVQFHFLVYSPRLSNLMDILGNHDINEDIWGKFQKLNDNNFIIFMYNVLLKPKSKGRIILKSKDPNVYPLIHANYFDDPEDLQILINTTKKFILPLEKSKAFKDNGVKLSWLDLIDCRDFEKNSDEYLKCVAKTFTFSLYHPTGTAKMGPDNDQTAVVDPELSVRKVQALRVIDASIMPSVVRGNTNAASIMIGEKGASMVKKFWLKQHTELLYTTSVQLPNDHSCEAVYGRRWSTYAEGFAMDALASNITSVCPLAFSSTGGELFMRALTTVITAHCTIVDNEWPADASDEVIRKANAGEKYDYIVVGAGTAGSLVAGKLSVHCPECLILLVESGGDTDINSEVPAFLFLNQNTSKDWKYKVKPDGRSCLGFENNSCILSKGKGMGGSSSINAMLYVRGHSKDFTNWGKGWEYSELLPYFENQEKYFNLSHVINDYHNEWYDIIRNAWNELNFTSHSHHNEALIGTKKVRLLIRDGKRLNTAKIYVNQANSNVHIMKNTRVEKIVINKNRAEGVEIRNSNGIGKIMATREVILSTGTIATPQLLMLSGIGPKNHLTEIDIPCRLDLPVGQNLQDHVLVPLFLKTNKETNVSPKMVHLSLLQYMLDRSGPLSNIGITDFVGFLNTLNSSDQPDVQFHHLYYPKSDVTSLKQYLKAVGYRIDIVNNIGSLNQKYDLLGIYLTLLHPLSKGSVELLNKQPDLDPVIETNYLRHPDDVKTLINAVKLVRRLEETKIFKSLDITVIDIKLKGCSEHTFDTESYWKCYMSHMGTTTFHQVGTAKMGDDKTCVVDNDLLVRGIDNLRVADASIMPSMPGGNTMATTLVIAQKAVEMIKTKYSLKDEL